VAIRADPAVEPETAKPVPTDGSDSVVKELLCTLVLMVRVPA